MQQLPRTKITDRGCLRPLVSLARWRFASSPDCDLGRQEPRSCQNDGKRVATALECDPLAEPGSYSPRGSFSEAESELRIPR